MSALRCLNCNTGLLGAHCHVCGQKASTSRLTVASLLHAIPHAVFHVDRSVFGTMGALITRPGRAINEYLDGKRGRYFNPLTLMVMWASLSTLTFALVKLDKSFALLAMSQSMAAEFREFYALTLKYYTASLALSLPLAAIASWLFFRRWGRTYGEHLAINAFITAITTATFVPLALGMSVVKSPETMLAVYFVAGGAMLIYQAVVLYAVFARTGRRVLAGVWASAAVVLFFALLNAATYGFFFLVYSR
jgi:hypothetical protein